MNYSQKNLHRKAATEPLIQNVTPENVGWRYVGFQAIVLKAGESFKFESLETQEQCFTILIGRINLQVGEKCFTNLGDRKSVFEEKSPYAVYVPPKCVVKIKALTDCEIAISKAPAVGLYPVRLILPNEMKRTVRGNGSNTRYICDILPETAVAESLLVVEVITPAGNTSSYPPHKHDQNTSIETLLEETYYHRLNPKQGFAFQRIYTEDRTLDMTVTVENQDVVLVPKGHHPVGTVHGYDLYYLNTMAGPERHWAFVNDPKHEWLTK